MPVINKTNNKTIAKDLRICGSAWSKARGLMFTGRSCVERQALVFPFGKAKHQSLHMMFVFYPIDVLFIDEKHKVIEIKQGFRPFTLYNSRLPAKYVIELPQGSVSRSSTSLGDVISW